MSDLKGFRVAILATDGFEQSELMEPRKALEEAQAEVKIISVKEGEIQGFNHFDKGDRVSVDLTLSQVSAEDFDAVMLPGGALNADFMRMDENARTLLRQMNQEGKPIAAICHAPWVLISSGLVEGRTLTSYFTVQDDIRNAGGTWVDQEVVEDDNWVTSRQPRDLPAFNEAMVALFSRHRSKREARPFEREREEFRSPM